MAFVDTTVFSVEADVKKYLTDIQSAINANARLAKEFGKTTQAVRTLDEDGNVLSATITGIAKNNQVLTNSFKLTENGIQKVKQSINDATNVLKNFRQQAFDLGKKPAESIARSINLRSFLGQVGTGDKSSIANLFVNLRTEAGKAGVTIKRTQELFTQLKTGTLKDVTETERGVVKSLNQIINFVEKTNTKLANSRTQAANTAKAQFTAANNTINQIKAVFNPEKIRNLLNSTQNAQLANVFSNAQKAIARSGISDARTLQLLQQLQSGTLNRRGGLKEEEVAVVSSLSKIIATYNSLTAAIYKNKQALEQNKEKLFQTARAPVDALRGILLPRGNFKAGTDPALIARFENALGNLQEKIAKTGTNSTRLIELYKGLEAGILPPITRAERGIVKSLTQVSKAHEDATGAVNKFTSGFLISWRSVGRLTAIQGLHRVVSELISLFGQAREASTELANSINLIQAITLKTRESSDEWYKVIKKISDEFGSDINDVAKAAYEAIGNQITETTKDTEQFVTVVLKLSRVTQATARDAGATLAGLLNAYQLSVSSAERVAAGLFKAIDLGSFTLNDIAERLGRISPLANQAGIDLNEMLAAVAALSNEGRRADNAITILTALLQKILKPTEASEKFFKNLGFASGGAALQVLGLSGVIKEFKTVIDKEGVEGLVKYFDELRGLQAGVSLTTTAFRTLDKFIKEFNENLRGDFADAFKITSEDAIRKLVQEFNRLKNAVVDFSREFQKAFSEFNDKVGGLTSRFITLVTLVKNSVVVELIGGLITLGNYVLGSKNSIDLLSNALVTLATAIISSKIIGLIQTLVGSLSTLAAGGPVGLGIAAIGAIIVGTFTFVRNVIQQQRLNVLNSVSDFERINKDVIDDLVEVNKAATLKIVGETETRINNSKKLILGYLNKLGSLADNEKKLLQEAAVEVEATIESSLKARIERFKDYIKAIDKEINNLTSNVEKNLKTIEEVIKKRDLRNFENNLKGKTPAEQFDATLRKVKELELAIFNATDPEKVKNLFEETEKLLENVSKDQEKRFEDAEKNGKLATAIAARQQLLNIEKLRNQVEETYIQKLLRANDLHADQTKKLEKQKEIAAQLFGELRALTREALKIHIFDKETGDINNTQETIRRMTDLVSRMDAITRLLPNLDGADFKELNEARSTLLKDVNELGIRENIVDTFKNSVLKLADELQKSQTNIPANILASLKTLGIEGNNINEVRANATQLFSTLSKQFSDVSNALVNAKAQTIKDSATLQGLRSGFLNGNEFDRILAKEIPTDARNVEQLKKFIDLASNENVQLRLSNSVIDLFNQKLPKLKDALTNLENIKKLEDGIQIFKESMDKFQQLNGQILDKNIKLDTTIELNITALDRNTLAIQELSANLVGIKPINAGKGNNVGGNVNLGGVNINVNGAAAPQLVAAEVVKQINVQLRRGNVRLGERNA